MIKKYNDEENDEEENLYCIVYVEEEDDDDEKKGGMVIYDDEEKNVKLKEWGYGLEKSDCYKWKFNEVQINVEKRIIETDGEWGLFEWISPFVCLTVFLLVVPFSLLMGLIMGCKYCCKMMKEKVTSGGKKDNNEFVDKFNENKIIYEIMENEAYWYTKTRKSERKIMHMMNVDYMNFREKVLPSQSISPFVIKHYLYCCIIFGCFIFPCIGIACLGLAIMFFTQTDAAYIVIGLFLLFFGIGINVISDILLVLCCIRIKRSGINIKFRASKEWIERFEEIVKGNVSREFPDFEFEIASKVFTETKRHYLGNEGYSTATFRYIDHFQIILEFLPPSSSGKGRNIDIESEKFKINRREEEIQPPPLFKIGGLILSKQQFQKLLDKFNKIDKNNDKRISRRELTNYYRSFYPKLSEEELIPVIDGIFHEVDKNSDGYIDQKEFLKAGGNI